MKEQQILTWTWEVSGLGLELGWVAVHSNMKKESYSFHFPLSLKGCFLGGKKNIRRWNVPIRYYTIRGQGICPSCSFCRHLLGQPWCGGEGRGGPDRGTICARLHAALDSHTQGTWGFTQVNLLNYVWVSDLGGTRPGDRQHHRGAQAKLRGADTASRHWGTMRTSQALTAKPQVLSDAKRHRTNTDNHHPSLYHIL